MEHTTVSISLDRESLQQAVTYILEYLANTPPDMGQMDMRMAPAYPMTIGSSSMMAAT